MKKLLTILITICLISFSGSAWAAGTVTQSPPDAVAKVSRNIRTITFVCVGDSSNGSIPNTDTNTSNTAFIRGWYLYKIEAFPTLDGTAPDEAHIMIYDSDGLDLLGSEDGGTTPYAGLTMIHATLKRTCLGNLYLPRAGSHVNFFHEIRGVLTLDVDLQGTASADWTIVLTFVK
jgi:hypothetical protein